ncbi:PD-(D/E)XK nuclease family protein [Prevotella koreensis]|uniref:PD-(D/E)XK nuclease family protein n=1 Tax=Prevotella koreensis TaxID=2490854 RepID=UPI0028E7AEC7|nr:PD-(D/E)XK nuclease family protein [Prevotella koreensis]
MTSFLEHIAEDIIAKHGNDLSDITIVFPNKRASLFLNEALALKAGKPMWSPQYVTISELFRSQTETVVADPIKLVCELFKVYSVYHGSAELTLDKFYGWGQLMIADFDDIDKNMADADAVFSNVTAFHELESKMEFTPEQKKAIERFFNIVLDNENSELKENFIKVWNSLAEIYHKFNETLANQGLAYEGALYRKVIEDGKLRLNSGKYIFVGFNVVQEVETRLFSMLHEEGRALFYWDYDEYFMHEHNTVANEAGKYISRLREKFANQFAPNRTDIFDTMKEKKEIKYICAQTENIQARYISQWLNDNNRMLHGRRTAIVMCDETLLRTIIHCLPSEIPAVNVTTGYPLSQAPITTLITNFLALHSEGYAEDGHVFRLHFINSVLSHPYSRYVSEKALLLRAELNKHHRYFPKSEELMLDEHLSLLFAPVDMASENYNRQITKRMADIVKHIAMHFPKENVQENGFAVESLFRTYTLLTRIENLITAGDLIVGFETLRRLIMQIIGTTSIPFHGEPVEGVQIMGVLETRNLDFDHVLILSCNEGNMPKGVSDSSFIPHSIRYGHGLTTIENKVSVYAYYFNSIIQRCKDVTIVYNNSTEGGQTGEMSRFMVQMMVEKPNTWNISKHVLSAGQNTRASIPTDIPKDKKVATVLENIDYLSPTAINNYLYCQLRFFYRYVARLKENNESDDDTIDNRIFGLIFHDATEILYNKAGESIITRSTLQALLKDKAGIYRAIDEAFKKELFKVNGNYDFKPNYNGIQLINREVIRQYVEMLIRLDIKLAPFTIIGLEYDVFEDITIQTTNGERTIKVGGRIDRIDKVTDPESGQEIIRVVDYKTSSREITSPLADVEAVFDPQAKRDSHRDYYFQSMLYAMLISRQQKGNRKPVSPALLFIQHSYADDTNPILFFKPGKEKEYINDIASMENSFMENTKRIMAEIFDTTTTFKPTNVSERCNLCPYKKLCW